MPDPHDPAHQLAPALAIASPELYPEYYISKLTEQNQLYQSMWMRLFLRQRVTPEELEQMRIIVAKYGHHIRFLTIRSVAAFRMFEPVCLHLQALYLRFDWDWVKSFTMETIAQVKHDVQSFARRQAPTLVSLHVHMGLGNTEDLRQTIQLAGRERWRHFDAILEDDDYAMLPSLLPNVESGIFSLQSVKTLHTPLPLPHLRLRELELQVSQFDPLAFTAILQSFPNLQRLVVRDMFVGTTLDMCRDRIGSMLLIGRRALKPIQVAQIVLMLPDLLLIDCHELDADCWAALDQCCPRLVYPRRS
ncbi:hypothetical protein DFQ27_004762 [Actinomortierella ambigua]|uniref:Uncharacterized protein n=1 Tax=Actinomortierella ambigua TaxID=1343610 RepID=A0A9P6U3Y1_9FUNG|nr:hypothetical protein DFQ27_004762 [Actinomortierella ambigua]